MTEDRMLYQSVLDNPGDDTPRLVFADWLDENAEPGDGRAARAGFIRFQIAAARMEWDATAWRFTNGECWPCHTTRTRGQRTSGKCTCTDAWKELRKSADWKPGPDDYPARVPIWEWRFTWTRGFVSGFAAPLSVWCRDADQLTAAAPLETVEFTNGRARVNVNEAWFRGLRHWTHPPRRGDWILAAMKREWPRIEFTCESLRDSASGGLVG